MKEIIMFLLNKNLHEHGHITLTSNEGNFLNRKRPRGSILLVLKPLFSQPALKNS